MLLPGKSPVWNFSTETMFGKSWMRSFLDVLRRFSSGPLLGSCIMLSCQHHRKRSPFVLDGNEIRGLEQNPETKSRWAQMARSGKKVMQFLTEGRYVANVVDGKVTLYGGRG